MTSLHDLYTALISGSLRPQNPTAAIAALDLVSHLYGLPLAAVDLDAPEFAQAFPFDHIADIARPFFKRDQSRYRAFRNAVLDCQMLVAPGDVDGAVGHSLQRVARLCLGGTANALYGVTGNLPVTLSPQALTREVALSIDRSLDQARRARFRRGLSVLDSLHDHELARRSGLLPSRRIGRLPTVRDHGLLEPLPSTLRALRSKTPRPTQNAIDFLWRLAVSGGVFRPGEDPSPDEIAERFPEIARLDAGTHGMKLSDKARKKYLSTFARSLVLAGCSDPRVSSSRSAWRTLRGAVRTAGLNSDRLGALAGFALQDGLGPHEVTPGWCSERLARLDRAGANAFRRSAYFLDALRSYDRIPRQFLPIEPTGVERLRRRRFSPKPPPAPRPETMEPSWVREWKHLFAEARAQGFDDQTLSPLSSLRVRSVRARLAPRDLTVDWIVDLLRQEAQSIRTAVYAATRLLDKFATHDVLRPLVPTEPLAREVMARRRDRRPLSEEILAELTETFEQIGLSASARREAAAAMKALAKVSDYHSDLHSLLEQDLEALDWSPFSNREKTYKLVLDRLRVFRSLPWTKDWRALQRAVIEAGIPKTENPVPRLLPYAAGREPLELDAGWAAETDRALRSTFFNPPHGRADLALTFANNIRRLDRLHEFAAVADAGLLPPRIGAFRESPSA
jgi:hypothetical protein